MSLYKRISRLVSALLIYLSLQGLFALLHELYAISPLLRIILVFPAAKIMGDVVIALIERRSRHSFWEDWVRETASFSLLAIVALISTEFWKNLLQLNSPPDTTVVAVLAYLILCL